MEQRYTLEILDPTGHLTLAWNPLDAEEVAHARAEVEKLRAAGYSFFAVVAPDATGDEVDRGRGKLIVDRIEDPIEDPIRAVAPEAAPAAVAETEEVPRRRGRGTRTIATRPLRGG